MGLELTLMEKRYVDVAGYGITHNLTPMVSECGLYKPLWRPEEIPVVYAEDLIPYLQEGIEKLKADPEKYIKFSPPNGWGSYESFLQFVENVYKACTEHPKALVMASR